MRCLPTFAGEQYDLLRNALPGRDRDRLASQHITRCKATDGPTYQAIHACSSMLADEIEQRPIKYILGVGSAPLQYFWPGASIQRVHAVPFPVNIGSKTVWYYPVMDPAFVKERGGYKNAAMAVFKSDLVRFFKQRKEWGKPTLSKPKAEQVEIVNTREQFDAAIARMGDEPLGVDIETSKLKPYEIDAAILTASFSSDTVTIAFAVDHPDQRNSWAMQALLETVNKRRWIAHNASFELIWFLWNMPDGAILDNFDDSQALARLYYERETIASLEMVSHAALGYNVKIITGVSAAKIQSYSLTDVLPYNGLDALASEQIFRSLHKKVRSENYQRILSSILTTTLMELKGLPTDQAASQALRMEWGSRDKNKQWTGRIGEIEKSVRRLYEVKQFEAVRQQPFNLGSNDDVGIALVEFGRLKLPPSGKGKYVTDDKALEDATKDAEHPLVTAVQSYREMTKMVSTYIEPILDVPNCYVDGLLHPSYTVMLTATGRLSSSDPNIQNFPKRRHKEVRRQIIPPPGCLICPMDYGQLEARIIAMAALDAKLCDALINGYDIHSAWRDRILEAYPPYWDRLIEKTNQTEYKKVMKGGRDIIKTDFVFASFFGASATSCAARTGLPISIMQDIVGEFWRDFAGVASWIKKQRATYDDQGQVSTLTNRVRRGLLWGNETINSPIQGSAADVVLDAMNAMRALSYEMKDPYLMPRINVHDDLTFFFPDSDDVEDYIQIAADTLTQVRYNWQVVPFMVEVSLGKNWADVEEIAKFTGKYKR